MGMSTPEQQDEIPRAAPRKSRRMALLDRSLPWPRAAARVKQVRSDRSDIHPPHGIRKRSSSRNRATRWFPIVGDYTGMVGDPAVAVTRPQPRPGNQANARTYLEQFYALSGSRPPRRPVDPPQRRVVASSFADVIRLASQYTVSRLSVRTSALTRTSRSASTSCCTRSCRGTTVEIHADVEIGATEQKFNSSSAALQRVAGRESQIHAPVLARRGNA